MRIISYFCTNMISKARIKQIHGVEKKKLRQEEGLFVAEGPKLVGELLSTMKLRYLAATEVWVQNNPSLSPRVTDTYQSCQPW